MRYIEVCSYLLALMVPCGWAALCWLTNKEFYPLNSFSWVAWKRLGLRRRLHAMWRGDVMEPGQLRSPCLTSAQGHRHKLAGSPCWQRATATSAVSPFYQILSFTPSIPNRGVFASTQQKALAFSASFYVLKAGGNKGRADSSHSFLFLLHTWFFSPIISPPTLQTLQAHQRQRPRFHTQCPMA